MATVVRFYRASSQTLDGLLDFAERELNAALEQDLPRQAMVRSIQPVLYQMDGQYHVVITLLIDAPDDLPRGQLGFKIGG